MKKFLLYAGIALLTASPSQAQGQGPRKWSGEFDALVAGQTVQRIAGRQVQTVSPDQMVDAHVSVSDAEAVAQYITDNGFEAACKELSEKVNAHRNEIKGKLSALGAPSVTKLDQSKYQEMYDFLIALD